LVMASSHVAHDCVVGNHVVIINFAGLTGHVTVGDHATIGGLSGIHPFVRIGTHAYLGGCSKTLQDVPPFVIATGVPATARGAGVVGAGHMGQYHILALAELWDVDLVAICDTDVERARSVASQYSVRSVSTHHELAGLVDIATVAVPTDRHFEVARELLEAGVDVLVEQPMTST